MRKYLLGTALVLMTVWATGCIIIDAEKMESRKPATIRSDECVIHRGPAVDEPACAPAGHETIAVAEE